MNKYKISFIMLLIINIVVIGFLLFNNFYLKYIETYVKDGSLDNYNIKVDGGVPVSGFVPNSAVAIKIAKAVLEDSYIKPQLGNLYEVEYDKENEVWIVHIGKLLHPTASVVISKKDGRIIRAWKQKP